ncbi:hypothetical protein Q31b_22100 [Novipirellula aureliae]|uniref:Uncharacterized protein n=1 Tax=Novipirellula aureliae TaxID=2527966 RepID=A0A5C6E2L7_9BACT|nr:hypothetical protein [Novipirellula aureliae]TWU43172.1 hypothetical protein Q31b_22100 [Novipirellula aureliae]
MSTKPTIEINKLMNQFYDWPSDESEVGQIQLVDKVPPPYDQLLDHHSHMTVTVETFHGEKVDVDVLRAKRDACWYQREITLLTQQTKRPVLYGMVRLNVDLLNEESWRRIESRQTPLGRVLIENNLLCRVELCALWQVQVGPKLSLLMQREIGDTIYGRTALIYCNGDPAIELLEIVPA